jgi:hypothetical protein
MTRRLLCGLLAAGCLALGLATALVQAGNRDRAARLNEQMEACRMLEGVTRDNATAVLGADWGPLAADPTLLQRALEPRPPHSVPPPKAKARGAQP